MSLALFVTELAQEGLKFNTIQGILCGISYIHQLYEQPNPVHAFMIRKLIFGIKRSQPQESSPWKPISYPLLCDLIQAMQGIMSEYDLAMYSAAFATAYFGCMRVGEVAVSTEIAHVAVINHLALEWDANDQPSCRLYMPSFKSSNGRKVTLRLRRHPGPACPVLWLSRFLLQRGTTGIHLFRHQSGSPLTAKQVNETLSMLLQRLGHNASNYGAHSFRIGRCTDLVAMGYTDAQVRAYGRWASDAFRLYVRPDVIEC